jgi:phage-related protein
MATISEMMVTIGADTSQLDQATRRAQTDVRNVGNTVSDLAATSGTSMAAMNRQWRGMSEQMRNAMRQVHAELAPFRAQQQEIQFGFFEMAQGMDTYTGSTDDFMGELTAMGNRNRSVNDQMMAHNNMARMGFIQGVATMLAASTQSSKIAANFTRMGNPLYRTSNAALAVSGNLERLAARGQPAVLALRMLGPTANMKQLNDMTRMITGGIMRMNAVALVAAAGSAILYSKLAAAASKTVPGFKTAADQMKSAMGKAFQPMVQAFAAVVMPIMKVVTAVAQLAIKFNQAHPFLAKLIQGFLMIIPLLALILSPLAIGIGLFNGLMAAWGAISMLVMPLVTGFAAISGPVLIIAAVLVALVAVGVLVYKNWDTIKAKAIQIWGAIKNFFVSTWNAIKTTTMNVWNSITTFFSGLWTTITTVFTVGVTLLKLTLQKMWTDAVNLTKAVWNGITSFFSGLWNGIKTVFFTVINFIVNFVQSRFGYIITAVGIIFANVKNIFIQSWNIIKNIFLGAILIIMDIITGDFGSIGSHISQIMGNIMVSIRSIWGSIKTIVMTYLNTIKTFAINAWNGLKTGVINAANGLKNGAVAAWNGLKTSVINTGNAIKQGAINTWNGLKTGVISAVNYLKTAIPAAWTAIKNGVINAASALKIGAVNKVTEMKTSVTSTASGIKDGIVKAWNGAKNFLTGIDLSSIGKNIMQGLLNGIESKAKAVWNAIQKVANGIKNLMEKALTIKSPSRWMRDRIGKNLMLGLSIGIDTNSGTVMDSLGKLTDDVQAKAKLDLTAPNLPTFSNNVLSKQQKTDPVYIIELDGRQIAKGTLPHITDIVRLKTGLKFS